MILRLIGHGIEREREEAVCLPAAGVFPVGFADRVEVLVLGVPEMLADGFGAACGQVLEPLGVSAAAQLAVHSRRRAETCVEERRVVGPLEFGVVVVVGVVVEVGEGGCVLLGHVVAAGIEQQIPVPVAELAQALDIRDAGSGRLFEQLMIRMHQQGSPECGRQELLIARVGIPLAARLQPPNPIHPQVTVEAVFRLCADVIAQHPVAVSRVTQPACLIDDERCAGGDATRIAAVLALIEERVGEVAYGGVDVVVAGDEPAIPP